MNNAKCHVHFIMRTDLSDPEHARREYKLILNAQTNCLFRRERNDCVSFHFSYRITYLVGSLFGTERFYLKCSHLNAALQRSTFRNDRQRSGMIAFPSKQGLRTKEIRMFETPCFAVESGSEYTYNVCQKSLEHPCSGRNFLPPSFFAAKITNVSPLPPVIQC